jgi:hypothetical protein
MNSSLIQKPTPALIDIFKLVKGLPSFTNQSFSDL